MKIIDDHTVELDDATEVEAAALHDQLTGDGMPVLEATRKIYAAYGNRLSLEFYRYKNGGNPLTWGGPPSGDKPLSDG